MRGMNQFAAVAVAAVTLGVVGAARAQAATVEERVDRILTRKSAVSDTLVTGGESFLLKLAPEEFEEVVGLEADA